MLRFKKRYFAFVSLMVILSSFLPVVFNNLPPGFRSHHIWAILWLTSVILLERRIYRDSTIWYLILYGGIVLIMYFYHAANGIDGDNYNMFVREFYEISVAITMFTYYKINKDYSGLSKLVKVALISIIITAVFSIFSSFINPNYARDIVGIASFYGDERLSVLKYKSLGGGGYGFFSSLVFLFPILVYYYKFPIYSFYSRIIILFVIILLFFCLIQVQFFANIIIAVIFIILSVLSGGKIFKSLSILFFAGAILVLVPNEVYILFLNFISTFFVSGSNINLKILDLADFLLMGGYLDVSTEVGIRAGRYPLLFESFMENPFFGGSYTNHHLFLMNKLATYGIIGFLSFALVIISHLNSNLRIFNRLFSFYYLLSFISFIALGMVKAVFGREVWYMLFFIIPAMSFTIFSNQNSPVKNNYLKS